MAGLRWAGNARVGVERRRGTHMAGWMGGGERTRQGGWAARIAHGGVEGRRGTHTAGRMGSGERTRRAGWGHIMIIRSYFYGDNQRSTNEYLHFIF